MVSVSEIAPPFLFEERYRMNPKVKSVLNSVLERFETGDISEAIAHSMFPFPDVPPNNE